MNYKNFENNVLACRICGASYKENKVCAGDTCYLAYCDGIIRYYNILLLPIVQNLSAKGFYVEDAKIIDGLDCMGLNTLEENEIEINILFHDDYGDYFPPLPNGFSFYPEPNPSKHQAPYPIKVSATIRKESSNIAYGKAILKAIVDFIAWAEQLSYVKVNINHDNDE